MRRRAEGADLVLCRGLAADAILVGLVVIGEFTHDSQAANLRLVNVAFGAR